MKVQWGINHIQNLKEVGKNIPKNLNEVDLEPDSDGDYRCQAVSWAEKIFNEVEQKVPFEIYSTNGKIKSWTPVFASDLKQPSNFFCDDNKLPKFLCELVNDEILEFID